MSEETWAVVVALAGLILRMSQRVAGLEGFLRSRAGADAPE